MTWGLSNPVTNAFTETFQPLYNTLYVLRMCYQPTNEWLPRLVFIVETRCHLYLKAQLLCYLGIISGRRVRRGKTVLNMNLDANVAGSLCLQWVNWEAIWDRGKPWIHYSKTLALSASWCGAYWYVNLQTLCSIRLSMNRPFSEPRELLSEHDIEVTAFKR